MKHVPAHKFKASPRSPTDVDKAVAARIQMARKSVGMSQERLGELLGVTFQQVQKYGTGMNRVSASRLYQIANAVGVPIGYFFEDVENRNSYDKNIKPLIADSITARMNRLLSYKDVQLILQLDRDAWITAVLPVVKALTVKKGASRG